MSVNSLRETLPEALLLDRVVPESLVPYGQSGRHYSKTHYSKKLETALVSTLVN